MRHRITDSEWRTLAAAYHADPELTLADIGRQAGCSYQTVLHHFARLGIARKPQGPHTWTADHTAYLLAHADDPLAAQAEALGRTVAHVKRRRAAFLATGLIPRRQRGVQRSQRKI